jgi:hypothetical protein
VPAVQACEAQLAAQRCAEMQQFTARVAARQPLEAGLKMHTLCIYECCICIVPQAEPLQRPCSSLPHGFVTDVDTDALPPGLDEDTVRAISRRKREPGSCCSGGWRRCSAGSQWRRRTGASCRSRRSTSRR